MRHNNVITDRVSILGNRIDCFPEYNKLYDYIITDLRAGGAMGYVTVNNVHTMMEGYRSTEYRKIINEAYLSIPDGKPLEIVGRLKGNKSISRLFGPTVMENFIDWGRKDGVKHFFLGGSDESLEKLRSAIQMKFPDAKIVGMIAPPFKPLDEWDNEFFIKAINEAQPDFVWVGLGAPKQERWMFTHHESINALLFGIGAGFAYLAGDTKHAPQWMKKASLEWLYRLMQEPRRLWKRYFTTIPPFLFLVTLELLGFKLRSPKLQK